MSSSSKRAGIALLGAGLFATEAHLPALARLTSTTTLLAIYSRTLKSAATLAALAHKTLALPSPPTVYHDEGGPNANLDALLLRPDIDAVIISLPIIVQPTFVTAALTRGKHVLSEKPVAPSVSEGLKLIAEYERQWKGKLLWRVAENLEAEPVYRKVGALIKEGCIGKVGWWKLAMVSRMSKDNKYHKTPWRTIPEHQGGYLLDGGVHAAAVLRTALPSHPINISSHVSMLQKHLVPADTFTAIACSSDGSHGLFELSLGAPVGSRNEAAFTVTGERGWINVTFTSDKYRVALHKIAAEGNAEEEHIFEFDGEGVEKEVEYFVNVLRGEGEIENVGDPREALRDVAFIQAGLGSKGEQIDVEKLLGEGK